jgi:hypothetical protein
MTVCLLSQSSHDCIFHSSHVMNWHSIDAARTTVNWRENLHMAARDLDKFQIIISQTYTKCGALSTWRMVSCGMLRRVALERTDVSKELSASFIRVTRIGELGTTLALTSNRHTLHSHRRDNLKPHQLAHKYLEETTCGDWCVVRCWKPITIVCWLHWVNDREYYTSVGRLMEAVKETLVWWKPLVYHLEECFTSTLKRSLSQALDPTSELCTLSHTHYDLQRGLLTNIFLLVPQV